MRVELFRFSFDLSEFGVEIWFKSGNFGHNFCEILENVFNRFLQLFLGVALRLRWINYPLHSFLCLSNRFLLSPRTLFTQDNTSSISPNEKKQDETCWSEWMLGFSNEFSDWHSLKCSGGLGKTEFKSKFGFIYRQLSKRNKKTLMEIKNIWLL